MDDEISLEDERDSFMDLLDQKEARLREALGIIEDLEQKLESSRRSIASTNPYHGSMWFGGDYEGNGSRHLGQEIVALRAAIERSPSRRFALWIEWSAHRAGSFLRRWTPWAVVKRFRERRRQEALKEAHNQTESKSWAVQKGNATGQGETF